MLTNNSKNKMKAKKSLFSVLIAKVFCPLFGHKFRVSNTITNHIKEYQCEHCGEEVTDTANGFLAKLTPKFRETNAFLAQFHRRRTRKIFSEAS